VNEDIIIDINIYESNKNEHYLCTCDEHCLPRIKARERLIARKSQAEKELEFLAKLKDYKFKCGFSDELCDIFECNNSLKERISNLKIAIEVIGREL
jgi:hypothetical protein